MVPVRYILSFGASLISFYSSVPSPTKSASSYSNKRTMAFRTPSRCLPLNGMFPCLPPIQTSSHHSSIKRNGDLIYAATKPDATPVRKLCARHGTNTNNTAAEMSAHATRVAVLNGILTRYQDQMPESAHYRGPNHRTVNGNSSSQYPEASPTRKPGNWQYIPRTQDSIHRMGNNLANPNMVPIENTGRVYGTETFIGNQQVPQLQSSALRALQSSRLTNNNEGTRFPGLLSHGANNTWKPPATTTVYKSPLTNEMQLSLPAKGENCYMTNQIHGRSLPKSKVMGNRPMLFEGGWEPSSNTRWIEEVVPLKTMGNLVTQRKPFEEGWNGSYSPNRPQGGVSIDDINDMIDGFREVGMFDKSTTGDAIVGRRQALTGPNPIPSQRPIEVKDRGMDGASGDFKEMIIREAACGLKEPKPRRLTEIRMIIWMCRGQLGTPPLRRTVSEPPSG